MPRYAHCFPPRPRETKDQSPKSRALAGAVVLLTACGSPKFSADGDGGDVADGSTTDGGGVTDAAPAYLIADLAVGADPLLERTRAGDAWDAMLQLALNVARG